MATTSSPGPLRPFLEGLESREMPAAGDWLVEPFTRGAGTSTLPVNWSQWTSTTGQSVFAVNHTGDGLGGQGHLVSNAGSATGGRTWVNSYYPAAVEASAAVFLNSVAQTQLFVRGRDLT
ncbi:MAG: hypothetical protein ABGY75_01915, partial [Gemmataceae bacterium]